MRKMITLTMQLDTGEAMDEKIDVFVDEIQFIHNVKDPRCTGIQIKNSVMLGVKETMSEVRAIIANTYEER